MQNRVNATDHQHQPEDRYEPGYHALTSFSGVKQAFKVDGELLQRGVYHPTIRQGSNLLDQKNGNQGKKCHYERLSARPSDTGAQHLLE